MSESISKLSLNTLIEKKIVEYKCPKCSLVPFINITINENKLLMTTKCTNNHIYSNLFDKMKKMCIENPLANLICDICENENKKISEFYYYCSVCFKFYCLKHKKFMN